MLMQTKQPRNPDGFGLIRPVLGLKVKEKDQEPYVFMVLLVFFDDAVSPPFASVTFGVAEPAFGGESY